MEGFADIFLFSVFLLIAGAMTWVIYTAWSDRHQKEHAILINYPVIGHLRYVFEYLGKFFRQYWFTTDDEERPFSRATRNQVYRMSKGISNNLSFGSTSAQKEEVFKNSLFPLEKHEAETDRCWVIGKDCDQPFIHNRLINISGMSFGALSANAIKTLSQGAARHGMTLNTGEGGKPSIYHHTSDMMNPDNPGKLVVQIGTANFGFRNEKGNLDYTKLEKLKSDDAIAYFQIKISQGAKPGLGGILPGAKVTPEIAELRDVPVGVDCVSPGKNPDCDTPIKLLKTIRKIKVVTGKPVGIKLSLASVDELRELFELALKLDKEMLQGGPSHLPSTLTIDGGDGGTGSAPALFMESLGLPVRYILSDVNDLLVDLGIRQKIHLVASGRLVTAHDAAVALALGADSIESARGFLMAIGCINALECSKGTCPVGIATQDKKLQRALVPETKTERVIAYAKSMEKELFNLAVSCGLKHPQDLRGRHLIRLDQTDNSGKVFHRGKH